MDFSKIKKLVQQNGDKFIFLENGEPEVVVMSFKEYEKLSKIRPDVEFASLDTSGLKETELVAPLEENYPSIGFDSAPVIAESVGLPVRLEDIRLEDLPI